MAKRRKTVGESSSENSGSEEEDCAAVKKNKESSCSKCAALVENQAVCEATAMADFYRAEAAASAAAFKLEEQKQAMAKSFEGRVQALEMELLKVQRGLAAVEGRGKSHIRLGCVSPKLIIAQFKAM